MNNRVKYLIGHTINGSDRYKASSGGIGTAITRYLLSSKEYGTAITFQFNKELKLYEPRFIYDEQDLNVCGSIYQDINIALFVKDNIDQIKNGIVVSCPPCQVAAIRNTLDKNCIKSFIISFCCSGQTTVEGTWKYYEFLGINKDDVTNLQYRGNGWPSGIQITLKNGKTVYHDNWTEPWITIHQAGFYRPKRCFYCTFDSSYQSDISLADPWLKEYLNQDKIGSTLFFTNTEKGQNTVDRMREQGLIEYVQSDYNAYYSAQQPNVEKKNRILNRQKELKREIAWIENPHIRNYFTSSLTRMKRYIKWRNYSLRLTTKKRIKNLIMGLFFKIKNKLRYWITAPKLGSHKGNFNISGGVVLNNPKCIHFGNNVGIGANAFFLPVVSDHGHTYQPAIVIGDGTWIGKNCSIAAINRVEIGKNVLFAGQVHITDHSHGYEDIARPISPQPLITKGPVVIDDDCWLGFSCEILSGVHIGKHSVVAARSVVTKDVPSYSIVAGNPARLIKQYNFETKKWEKVQK